MRTLLLAAVTLAALTRPAWATMPLLGEKPTTRTDEACWAWAKEQAKDNEVAFMWGLREDGSAERAIAERRLADDCVGKPKPDIVGVGSSAGYDRNYRRGHRGQPICSRDPRAPALLDGKPW